MKYMRKKNAEIGGFPGKLQSTTGGKNRICYKEIRIIAFNKT